MAVLLPLVPKCVDWGVRNAGESLSELHPIPASPLSLLVDLVDLGVVYLYINLHPN